MIYIAIMALISARERIHFAYFEDKVCTLLLAFSVFHFYDTIRRQTLSLFYPFETLSGRDLYTARVLYGVRGDDLAYWAFSRYFPWSFYNICFSFKGTFHALLSLPFELKVGGDRACPSHPAIFTANELTASNFLHYTKI